jgi:Ca2+-binding RTX toxin-like protein
MRSTNSFAFRPTLDTLTDRVVPSVSLINGDLHISSTQSADYVRIRHLGANYVVTEGNVESYIPVSRVTGGDIVFNGLGGDDRFVNVTYLRSQVNGGAGNDTLSGGYAGDLLQGGGGTDYLYGNGGSDYLYAYSKAAPTSEGVRNYLYGGEGMDFVHGSNGHDFLDGGLGEDYLEGYGGNDIMHAAYGIPSDTSYNYFNGGVGNDTLHGSNGYDYMLGHHGNDTLYGNGGNDMLSGGNDADKLFGGLGLDELSGGWGNDELRGGIDGLNDVVFGDGGADSFEVEYAGNQLFDFLRDYRFGEDRRLN